MDKVNSKMNWLIITILAISIAFGAIWYFQAPADQKTGAGITLDKYKLSGATSTSSPLYLSPNLSASSTAELIMSVTNATHIDLNMAVVASTSAVINYEVYFSSDDGANKQWYGENGYTATSNILRTEGPSNLVHSWTTGATTVKYKNIGIEPVASKYMKVRFYTTVASSSVYAEGITQSMTD